LEDPAPTARRSRRLAGLGASVLQTLLCCMLLFAPSSLASNIQPLKPGLNVIKIGEVGLLAHELIFSVRTDVNVSADLGLVKNQMMQFKGFCDALTEHVKTQQQCTQLYTNTQLEADSLSSMLSQMYDGQRFSRAVPYQLMSSTGRFLWSKIPWGKLAIGATVAYQTHMNYKLENEIDEVKEHISRTTSLLANSSRVSYDSVKHELNTLVTQQNLLLLEEDLTKYAEASQALISEINVKHQRVGRIEPISELKTVVAKDNEVMLPPTLSVSELFSWQATRKRAINGLVEVIFTIPLIQRKMFTHMAVIRSPSASNVAMWREDNVNNIVQIAVCPTSKEFFLIDDTTYVGKGICYNVTRESLSSCHEEIIKNETDPKTCVKGPVPSPTLKVFPLGKDSGLAIVFKKEGRQVNVTCGDKTSSIKYPASLVHYEQCDIRADGIYIAGVRSGFSDLNLTSPEVNMTLDDEGEALSAFTDDPRLKKINAELDKELEDLQGMASHQSGPNLLTIIAIVAGLLVIVIFIIALAVWKVNSQQRRLPLPNARGSQPLGSWAAMYLKARNGEEDTINIELQ
jgi:hypothetical protein